LARRQGRKAVTKESPMKTDLHIHSKCSDGKFSVDEILAEARARGIGFLAVTDHDSIAGQNSAVEAAKQAGIRYVCGVELNVTFSHPKYREGKLASLDFLGYQFNPEDKVLKAKLDLMAWYREERAAKILANLNAEFAKEGIVTLTTVDLAEIGASVDGVLGRPHIADYLVKKGIVATRQEAFDKYLVRCDVPKYPLYLEEASRLIRGAGGKLVLAHPNDPHGTSLNVLTKSLQEQTAIVQESMLGLVDGLECWHSRHDTQTTEHYLAFAKTHNLLMTGGSDCHQKPIIMGTVPIPDWIATEFHV
jgi:3',5'-nucleoside bisphosphate phosphatase